MGRKRMNLNDDMIRSMYESGSRMTDIAKICGVSSQTIANRIYEMGIPSRGHLHDSEWFDLEKAIDMYVNQGIGMQRIAAEMWVSTGKVKKELHKAGVFKRGLKPGVKRRHKKEELC